MNQRSDNSSLHPADAVPDTDAAEQATPAWSLNQDPPATADPTQRPDDVDEADAWEQLLPAGEPSEDEDYDHGADGPYGAERRG